MTPHIDPIVEELVKNSLLNYVEGKQINKKALKENPSFAKAVQHIQQLIKAKQEKSNSFYSYQRKLNKRIGKILENGLSFSELFKKEHLGKP